MQLQLIGSSWLKTTTNCGLLFLVRALYRLLCHVYYFRSLRMHLQLIRSSWLKTTTHCGLLFLVCALYRLLCHVFQISTDALTADWKQLAQDDNSLWTFVLSARTIPFVVSRISDLYGCTCSWLGVAGSRRQLTVDFVLSARTIPFVVSRISDLYGCTCSWLEATGSNYNSYVFSMLVDIHSSVAQTQRLCRHRSETSYKLKSSHGHKLRAAGARTWKSPNMRGSCGWGNLSCIPVTPDSREQIFAGEIQKKILVTALLIKAPVLGSSHAS